MTYETTFSVLLSATNKVGPTDPLMEKMRAFSRLADGWSYGRGRRIRPEVIRRAEKILEFGRQLGLRPEVFPGVEGDVVIALHQAERCVQTTVNEDLTFGLRVEQGHGFQYEDVIEPIQRVSNESDVYRRIKELVPDDDKWKSRESSISSTLVEYADVSSTPPSRTPPR